MEPSASLIILGFLDASHIYLISPSRPALPPINRAADFELCFLGPLASTWQALKAAGPRTSQKCGRKEGLKTLTFLATVFIILQGF